MYFNGCNDPKNEKFIPFCNLKRYFLVQNVIFDEYTNLVIDKIGESTIFKSGPDVVYRVRQCVSNDVPGLIDKCLRNF